ncbi:alpha/beta family hydrolase [Companilactobacillus ginsenosidimutans]|uniref:Carboxymethylenebutenolidase n=1 Tax=Companilactobacillus ginsenosidimutans TaxID=1007676 RepID=A0A0H4QJY4_9LACO|nr:alpha/beta family hydrolase [Companilactobacillus ginsenosidimutans]AKP68232.1 carboxymethylenebutenolidase [Companilactobacillus ginsenosidimutans]
MKNSSKWLFRIIATILIIATIIFGTTKVLEYQPSSKAEDAAKSSTQVLNTTKFQGDDSKPMVIFYPGALVDPKSYSIWAEKVAAAGYSVYIVRFTLDLAVLNPNVAKKIQQNKNYIIGGHSLGGTMAARYAHDNPKDLKGVFFLASYPEEKGDLKKAKVPVLSITGTNDGVLNQSKFNGAKKYLPTTTVYTQITGGNHAGFGSYGKQRHDKKASISNARQQDEISNILITWLNNSVIK